MNGSKNGLALLALACGLNVSAANAGVCPCAGDVNNDGSVNGLDGVCIAECKDGDCSCCLSSCDVNCDGVVDAGDAGDEILNDDSTWLCLFLGAAPEYCCSTDFQDTLSRVDGIPAVSDWGLAILGMLILTAGTLMVRLERSRSAFVGPAR